MTRVVACIIVVVVVSTTSCMTTVRPLIATTFSIVIRLVVTIWCGVCRSALRSRSDTMSSEGHQRCNNRACSVV